jgi:hypothetical protein
MTPITTLGTLVLSLLVIPLVLGICLKAPKLVVMSFIGVLFTFSSSTWGQLQVENTIYSRGVGVFYFSLLNLILFVAGVATLIRKLANPHNPYLAAPLGKYFLAFLFMLAAHIILGVAAGIDLDVILGYNGIINILNMLIFMYLVVMAFNDEKDMRRLLLTIIVLAGARAVFGIVRFIWFDGDSANPYRNFERLDIKIAFFDIADNFIASLAAFVAAWLLTSPGIRLGLLRSLGLYLFLGLEIAAVALSFRRASLIGLALMFALLLFRLPSRQRLKFILLASVILCVTAGVFFRERLQFNTQGNVLSSLVYDIAGENGGIKENRFYELYAAAQSLTGNWLFGLGSWGGFKGDASLLDYHFGNYDFVHSGFGHIILKSGLVGLALFLSLMVAYTSFYFRSRKHLTGNARLMSDAGFAGFLFWIPTLLIGTPIIEFRSMLLIGLTLAMPFVAVGLQKYGMRRYVIA